MKKSIIKEIIKKEILNILKEEEAKQLNKVQGGGSEKKS